MDCPLAIGAAVALPNIGGYLSGLSAAKNLDWYLGLNRPPWTPPGWIFQATWTTLYSTMGYASYLVYKTGGGFQGSALIPLMCYGGQLALNFAWDTIFFGCHSTKWAFYDMVAMDLAVIATAYQFYQIKPVAGILIMPYLAWLSYATSFSFYIYKKNPTEDKKK